MRIDGNNLQRLYHKLTGGERVSFRINGLTVLRIGEEKDEESNQQRMMAC